MATTDLTVTSAKFLAGYAAMVDALNELAWTPGMSKEDTDALEEAIKHIHIARTKVAEITDRADLRGSGIVLNPERDPSGDYVGKHNGKVVICERNKLARGAKFQVRRINNVDRLFVVDHAGNVTNPYFTALE